MLKEFKRRNEYEITTWHDRRTKKELGYLVKKYGFRHQKVISVSQKLDLLVYKAMNIYGLDHKIRTKKESLS